MLVTVSEKIQNVEALWSDKQLQKDNKSLQEVGKSFLSQQGD